MRLIRHAAFAVLCAISLGLLTARPLLMAFTVACHNRSNTALAEKGWVDVNGIRHLTFSWACGFAGQDTVRSATNAWNAHKETTRVQFDEVGCGDSGDIYIDVATDPIPTGACSGYSADQNDFIGLDPDVADLNDARLQFLLVHEFGHVLGLDHHEGESSVMDVPFYTTCDQNTIENILPASTPITQSDAMSARTCVVNKTTGTFDNGDGEIVDRPSEDMEDCVDRYRVVITWQVAFGELSIIGYFEEFLGTFCGPLIYG